MSEPRTPAKEVTNLLHAWRDGDEGASDALLGQVYATLRDIARGHLRSERQGHTLQPTALVHEAYVRLLGQRELDWRDRVHFFGLASMTMRRILVDYARRRLARKRSVDAPEGPITLETSPGERVEVIDLDRALTRFAERFPRPAKVVEMRYFAGLDLEEIATALDVTERTVKRDWRFARAWLRDALAGGR